MTPTRDALTLAALAGGLSRIEGCAQVQEQDGWLTCLVRGQATRLAPFGADGQVVQMHRSLDAMRIHHFSRAEALPVANNHNACANHLGRAYVDDDNVLCATLVVNLGHALDDGELASTLRVFDAECGQLQAACDKASQRRA